MCVYIAPTHSSCVSPTHPPTVPHHITLDNITPHNITPHLTTPHNTTPHHTISHHITPHHITPHHTTPHLIPLYIPGTVYFSDSTRIQPIYNPALGHWDTLTAYILDLLTGQPTGRLLQFDAPGGGGARVLAEVCLFVGGRGGRDRVLVEVWGVWGWVWFCVGGGEWW